MIKYLAVILLGIVVASALSFAETKTDKDQPEQAQTAKAKRARGKRSSEACNVALKETGDDSINWGGSHDSGSHDSGSSFGSSGGRGFDGGGSSDTGSRGFF